MSFEQVAGTLVPSLQQQGINGLFCRAFLFPRSLDCVRAAPARCTPPNRLRPAAPATAWPRRERFSVFSGRAGGAKSQPARTKISTSIPSLFERYLAPAGFAHAKPATPRAPGYVIPAQRRVVGVMHETLVGARVGASCGPRLCSGGRDVCPGPGARSCEAAGQMRDRL
jgi:hypothetical protein